MKISVVRTISRARRSLQTETQKLADSNHWNVRPENEGERFKLEAKNLHKSTRLRLTNGDVIGAGE